MTSELNRGDRVAVATDDWERGTVEIRATVTRILSDTHVRVRVDDGLVFAVPVAACTLIGRAEQ